jgi:hypothetical protein
LGGPARPSAPARRCPRALRAGLNSLRPRGTKPLPAPSPSPSPSQATRAYLHAEDDVEASLQKAGFKVVKKEMTATKFYFSRLFEAIRV